MKKALLKAGISRTRIREIMEEYDDDVFTPEVEEIIERERKNPKGARRRLFVEKDKEEDDDDYVEEDILSPSTLQENCLALNALVKLYSVLPEKHTPYASTLLSKCKKVADRIEPMEEGQPGNLDNIVGMTDRIRLLCPGKEFQREDLFDIGIRAKELHIELYGCPPSRVKRKLDDGEHWINVYTEETAPGTLDVAIKEWCN